MKLAVIGFGNAGGKISDRLLTYQQETDRSFCRFVLAINSARTDLEKLDAIPREQRVLIGQTDERVKGHGAGADPEIGAEIAELDRTELERAISQAPIHDIDAFLVVAGLGGGTGSGGAPVLASYIRDRYEEPVYGLGVFPSADEGGRATLNAARSFPSLVEATDNVLLFDNDNWRKTGETVEAGYQRINQEIAERFGTVLAAGEADGTVIAENAMDSSDIRRTLSTGGVTTIAYAESALDPATYKDRGLLGRLRGMDASKTDGETDPATKLHGVVRQAVQSRLTCPAEIRSAERSLIVVSGPPREFSQKGLERARQWLEEQTGSVEVLAGDDPRPDADALSAAVILSNVTDVPRIDRLQQKAVDAKQNIETQEASRDRAIQELITDEGNELDPI